MRRAFALLTAPMLALTLVGCTAKNGAPVTAVPALKLVSYVSCDELLASVRQAAKASVGPYGFGMNGDVRLAMPEMARADGAAGAAPPQAGAKAGGGAQQSDYSGTNTHEKGVDEPDLVKTDGKRIVVVNGGSLHVIDAASRRETHRLPVAQNAYQILMNGNRVLVLSNDYGQVYLDGPSRMMPFRGGATQLQLFDIGGVPKVVGEYKIDGRFIDARQVGTMVRVVVASTPTIAFPKWESKSTPERMEQANREAIDKAPIEDWLPDVVVNGQSKPIDCSEISRPDEFSGASMVTLLSFDLGAPTLTEGEPVVLMADGDTVYGSGPNLYVANDQRWRMWRTDTWNSRQFKAKTDFYQYDVTTPKPTYVASGSVPGWLLNQYSMSEFDGVLRVATTDTETSATSSAVYTLQKEGGSLKQVGEVGGLGKGERIYAVRFVGKVGYVVTFRQTDPLYTIDLADPRKPRVVGELKIPGYSAYLHPVSESRLLGVGQDATDQGRVQGTQVSLFDVGNLSEPKRVAQHKMARAYSEAESDPHAFLYWPATKLLVIPVNSSALLLRVDDASLSQIATISHSSSKGEPIRRSLVIGDTLWTISSQGAMASSLDGARELGFVNL